MVADLTPGVLLAAARAKAALRAKLRERLLANAATRDLSQEQLDAITEDTADVCIQRFLSASETTVNVNVNANPK